MTSKQIQEKVEKLNQLRTEEQKFVFDKYTDGYGLSVNHIIVASGLKNISKYLKEAE